jgi:alpha-ketoglutarate-dependent taurine dioxygenase
VDELEAVCNAVAVEHFWQDHDLLVIDNSRVMHARKALAADVNRVIWLLMARV